MACSGPDLLSMLRIYHIDDNPGFTQLLQYVMKDWDDVMPVGYSNEAREGLELCCGDLQPDILLLDVSMPLLDGFEIASAIKRRAAAIRTVFLTGKVSDLALYRISKSDAHGAVLKGYSMLSDIRRALPDVANGVRFFSPEMRNAIDKLYRNPAAFFKILSDRELELVRFLIVGLSDKQIAEQLGIAWTTVHSHRLHIMRKLGLHKSIELVHWAARAGFVDFRFPEPQRPPFGGF